MLYGSIFILTDPVYCVDNSFIIQLKAHLILKVQRCFNGLCSFSVLCFVAEVPSGYLEAGAP